MAYPCRTIARSPECKPTSRMARHKNASAARGNAATKFETYRHMDGVHIAAKRLGPRPNVDTQHIGQEMSASDNPSLSTIGVLGHVSGHRSVHTVLHQRGISVMQVKWAKNTSDYPHRHPQPKTPNPRQETC